MDVFRNMELFVEVAASGGFRAAAERLGERLTKQLNMQYVTFHKKSAILFP
jgi:hypothetical protein